MTVALVTHADCILHEMGMHHPESPERLKAVLDALDASGFGGQLTEHEAPLAGAERARPRARATCTSTPSTRRRPTRTTPTSTPTPP